MIHVCFCFYEQKSCLETLYNTHASTPTTTLRSSHQHCATSSALRLLYLLKTKAPSTSRQRPTPPTTATSAPPANALSLARSIALTATTTDTHSRKHTHAQQPTNKQTEARCVSASIIIAFRCISRRCLSLSSASSSLASHAYRPISFLCVVCVVFFSVTCVREGGGIGIRIGDAGEMVVVVREREIYYRKKKGTFFCSFVLFLFICVFVLCVVCFFEPTERGKKRKTIIHTQAQTLSPSKI